MASRAFELVPVDVPRVETENRRIVTPIPHPDSVPMLERLRAAEPQSMRGQPLVVWDRAKGVHVYDPYGNKWLDFSSGVLVANSGHGNPKVLAAAREVLDKPLVHTYCFPHEWREKLTVKLAGLLPWDDAKVFLLTTGSEANEVAIKLAITRGTSIRPDKDIIISYRGDFHGIPALKNWLRPTDQFVQVPWPGDLRVEDKSFDLFEKSLAEAGVDPDRVAGVLFETYQGGNAEFAPVEYMKKLREWCDAHRVVMIADEVQAGFGRTGTFWAFEHYDVVPNLICCGKGITSSLPLSAVLGESEVMDLYPPGSMTSTHTGNPVCCAAALANIEIIERENLVENAKKVGEVLHRALGRMAKRHSDVVGAVHGKGLVAGVHIVKPGSKEPDGDLAFRIVEECVRRGLLMFSPVGYGGATVKISPPLVITAEAVEEGASVLDEAISAAKGT